MNTIKKNKKNYKIKKATKILSLKIKKNLFKISIPII
jgi:hypothetical protein